MELVCSAGHSVGLCTLFVSFVYKLRIYIRAALAQGKKLRWDFSDLFVSHCTTCILFLLFCARSGNAHLNNNKCVASADGKENFQGSKFSFSAINWRAVPSEKNTKTRVNHIQGHYSVHLWKKCYTFWRVDNCAMII
jgi:hypothetical protein